MDLKNLPKLKESKTKIKMTFCLSKEAYETYILLKNKGYDSTKVVTDAIEKTMNELKEACSSLD